MLRTFPYTIDAAWRQAIVDITKFGNVVAPRGKDTVELPHYCVTIDMRTPVLVNMSRKLNYSAMAAEALWILQGDDRLDGIAPWIPRYSEFSDDGITLAGAYGPRIMGQERYVVDKLLEDRDTRQAAISIWSPNPKPSRDYPCTMSMVFNIRDGNLHTHVFMRSSDVWLGLPYDLFTFSMVSAKIATLYNGRTVDAKLRLGSLYLTAASSHLYRENWNDAQISIADYRQSRSVLLDQTPIERGEVFAIMDDLQLCRQKDVSTQPRYWQLRPQWSIDQLKERAQ